MVVIIQLDGEKFPSAGGVPEIQRIFGVVVINVFKVLTCK